MMGIAGILMVNECSGVQVNSLYFCCISQIFTLTSNSVLLYSATLLCRSFVASRAFSRRISDCVRRHNHLPNLACSERHTF
jgi:hypothetical protein